MLQEKSEGQHWGILTLNSIFLFFLCLTWVQACSGWPVWFLMSPPCWPHRVSTSVSYHHLLLFQFLPPHPSSSSLTAIREKNNHIDRADKLEQESENMNSHMCQRQSEEVEEEEEEWTDISVCLIVVLILWQTPSQFKFWISEATRSNKCPGISPLTFLQRHIDI